MRAALAAVLAALSLGPAAAAAVECPRLSLAADAAAASVPESPGIAVGGRAILSFRCVALATELDWQAAYTRHQPAFSRVGLVGAGAMLDVHPRLSVHALAVAGGYYVQVRDYVYGGWRDAGRSPWALGASAGARWRILESADGHRALPVLGLAATLLRVSPEQDRLRQVSWGGWVPMLAVTVGLELRPARR